MTTTWTGDWQKRIYDRVESLGCKGVIEFVGMFPAESYVQIAKRLGEDVAALQLMRLQFAEAKTEELMRHAAMDALVRILNESNRRGWNVGLHAKRRLVNVYADWVTTADENDMAVKGILRDVWTALKESNPPTGWLPASIDDPIITAAFEKGWKLPNHS